jgi:hemolysin activation/secretion protein
LRQLLLYSLPIVAAALCLANLSHAQSGATQPGRIERDTRPLPEPIRRDSVRIDTPRFAEQVPPGAQEVRFLLGEVQVFGSNSMPTQSLAPIWAGLIGKPITLAEAFGIAAAISARYREAGFILSQAVIPPQDIRTVGVGVLRIQVIEGFIDKVTVTGLPAAKLQPYLDAVQRERPLRLATLERSLLLIGELAGVTAQANLRASATPNASDLEIVTNQKRTEFSLSAHNRSTPSQGRARLEASAEVHGLIGDFDRHNLRWVTAGSKRLNLLAYSGDVPLGGNGLKLQLGASASRSEPATDLAAANIDTRSNNVSLGLAYPLLRSRRSNLSLRGGLNGYHNSADVAGARQSDDRIRALRLGLTADYADAWGGISLLDLEWSKGLSALGASKPDDANVGGDPQFSKLSAYAARLQSLGGNWSALLALTAQHSGDKLPTAEQLGLGGDTFLRAFDPSEVIGEKGAAGKLELRYDLGGARIASTVYVYGDAGSVKRKDDQGYASTSLSSAGIGVRLSGPYRTRGYFEVAKPGRKDVASENNRNARVFAGIGIDF